MNCIFSGVQPTGNLHLGNYLGAVRNWVRLQNDYECLFCLVDMHAITVWQDPAALKTHTREVAAAMLAAGVDPLKNVLFVQSQNPDHAQLAWIFNCVARIGWLNRMTQFKEKAGKNRENASVGLYAYPNLMSADILVYKATHVPVGEDQKQHLELARDTAQKFNTDYGVDCFPQPEPLILGTATRVMSLARRSQEDEQVGRVGLFAHQYGRRRRHHRAQAAQGQDRSPGSSGNRRRARQPPRGGQSAGDLGGVGRQHARRRPSPASPAGNSPPSSAS